MEALSTTALKQILAHIDHKPQKHLGQNFLIDSNILKKVLGWISPSKDAVFIEIGPGLGAISQALLKKGVKLHAVERDPVLVKYLQNTLEKDFPNLQLLHADAVEHPLAGYNGSESCHVIANLPFAISSPWLDAILSGPILPQSMVLFLQKEAADRFLAPAGSKDRGPLSIFLQAIYAPMGRHKVASTCFYPVPQVDAVLLLLQRRPDPYYFKPQTQRHIRDFFTQKRKQIGGLCRQTENPSLQAWVQALVSAGIPETSRPEVLPLWAWQLIES